MTSQPSPVEPEKWRPVATPNPYIPPESRPNALRRGTETMLGQELASYVNALESSLTEARERAEAAERTVAALNIAYDVLGEDYNAWKERCDEFVERATLAEAQLADKNAQIARLTALAERGALLQVAAHNFLYDACYDCGEGLPCNKPFHKALRDALLPTPDASKKDSEVQDNE